MKPIDQATSKTIASSILEPALRGAEDCKPGMHLMLSDVDEHALRSSAVLYKPPHIGLYGRTHPAQRLSWVPAFTFIRSVDRHPLQA